MIDYKRIEDYVKKAGQMVLNANLESASVEKKTGDANFCTEYDIKVQKFLIDELSEILPEASFFGEEDTNNNIKDLNISFDTISDNNKKLFTESYKEKAQLVKGGLYPENYSGRAVLHIGKGRAGTV